MTCYCQSTWVSILTLLRVSYFLVVFSAFVNPVNTEAAMYVRLRLKSLARRPACTPGLRNAGRLPCELSVAPVFVVALRARESQSRTCTCHLKFKFAVDIQGASRHRSRVTLNLACNTEVRSRDETRKTARAARGRDRENGQQSFRIPAYSSCKCTHCALQRPHRYHHNFCANKSLALLCRTGCHSTGLFKE